MFRFRQKGKLSSSKHAFSKALAVRFRKSNVLLMCINSLFFVSWNDIPGIPTALEMIAHGSSFKPKVVKRIRPLGIADCELLIHRTIPF